jgi:hypothetical protein
LEGSDCRSETGVSKAMSELSVTTLKHESATSDNITLASNGNVGIGTSSPAAKLDVVNGSIRVNEDGAGTKVLTIRSDWAGVDPAINVTTNNSLLLMTSNTERMRIDSAGWVTKPYQPAFTQSSLTGFNSTNVLQGQGAQYNFNRGGHYNINNGRFTAPIAGEYLIMCGVLVEIGTGRMEGKIEINGGAHAVNFNGTGTTYDGASAAVVVTLNANDYVRIIRTSGTAHSDGRHPNTYFSGYLLG